MFKHCRQVTLVALSIAGLMAMAGCNDKDAPTIASSAPVATPATKPSSKEPQNPGDKSAFCTKFKDDGTWMDELSDDPTELDAEVKEKIKKTVTDLAALAPSDVKADMDLVADTYVKVMDGQMVFSPSEPQIGTTIQALMRVEMWVVKACGEISS